MSWWSELSSSEQWIVLGGSTLLAFMLYGRHVVQYKRLLRDIEHRIHLAPIEITGGIGATIGARTVGLLLQDQFVRVQHLLRRVSQPSSSMSSLPGLSPIPSEHTLPFVGDFRTIDLALRGRSVDVGLPSELEVQEDLTIKLGTVHIPLGFLVNLIQGIVRMIPMPYRRRYLSNLIHLSITAVGDHVQVLVYRRSPGPQLSDPRHHLSNMSPSGASPMADEASPRSGIMSHRLDVRSLNDFSVVLRDAAFMILECHGAIFKQKKWLGIRCLAEGYELLEAFRQSGDPPLLQRARICFGKAAETDSTCWEAWYFYGALCLAERTRESIRLATMAFRRVLKAEDTCLLALAHTGLANCEAQRIHRLAERDPEVLAQAQQHMAHAVTHWKQSRADSDHPWILATRALVLHVDESGALDERRQRFSEAARYYLAAIRLDPENAMFYNNLGWVYLKMADWGLTDIGPFDTAEEPRLWKGDPERLAERCLKMAVDLDPRNKLAHANLCLLYALPAFRASACLDLCWFHGKTAIALDAHYINGHRDLAVSLLRYGRHDEAFVYFQKALTICGNMEKGREITNDCLQVLQDEQHADEHELHRWGEAALNLVNPAVP